MGAGELSGGGGRKGGNTPTRSMLRAVGVSWGGGGGVCVWCDGGGNTPGVSWAARVQI